jgi:hypothetical protein
MKFIDADTLIASTGEGLKSDVLVCWEVEGEVKAFSRSSGGDGRPGRWSETDEPLGV